MYCRILLFHAGFMPVSCRYWPLLAVTGRYCLFLAGIDRGVSVIDRGVSNVTARVSNVTARVSNVTACVMLPRAWS